MNDFEKTIQTQLEELGIYGNAARQIFDAIIEERKERTCYD